MPTQYDEKELEQAKKDFLCDIQKSIDEMRDDEENLEQAKQDFLEDIQESTKG